MLSTHLYKLFCVIFLFWISVSMADGRKKKHRHRVHQQKKLLFNIQSKDVFAMLKKVGNEYCAENNPKNGQPKQVQVVTEVINTSDENTNLYANAKYVQAESEGEPITKRPRKNRNRPRNPKKMKQKGKGHKKNYQRKMKVTKLAMNLCNLINK